MIGIVCLPYFSQIPKSMSSREKILGAIAKNQPAFRALPSLTGLGNNTIDIVTQFKTVLSGIGGQVIEVDTWDDIIAFVKEHYEPQMRVISTLEELSTIAETNWTNLDPHTLENVDLAILRGDFGVSENSAIWVTDSLLKQRVAPFIAQYLALVVDKNSILPSMHEAYQKIGNSEYGFGSFIAGPSKTADIEQSLVLGAHGARGLTVFLMK